MAHQDQKAVESVPHTTRAAVHPDDRAHQLLEATRKVMADFGVRRTTMSDVARAAGVSRQTVYEYFPSREELIGAALKQGAARLVEAGFDAAERAGGTPEQRLVVMLATALDFFRTSPLWASPGKRQDLVVHVTLEDGVYLGAGIVALEEALGTWWPNTDKARRHRAADTLARTLVSHGLAPSPRSVRALAKELAELVARGLQ